MGPPPGLGFGGPNTRPDGVPPAAGGPPRPNGVPPAAGGPSGAVWPRGMAVPQANMKQGTRGGKLKNKRGTRKGKKSKKTQKGGYRAVYKRRSSNKRYSRKSTSTSSN